MPTVVTTKPVTVYTFAELDPAAQQRAVNALVDQRAGKDYADGEREEIEQTIIFNLARALGTPGWMEHSEEDFPGVPSVELVAWRVNWGPFVAFKGLLTRANAPALPWIDGVDAVMLDHHGGDTTNVGVLGGESPDEVRPLHDAAFAAINAARDAGERQHEWLMGEEKARHDCEDDPEWLYHADGKRYAGPVGVDPVTPLDLLTDAQRDVVNHHAALNVVHSWFVGTPDDGGAVEVLGLPRGSDNHLFAWSLRIEADGDYSASEARIDEEGWSTGVTC
jgi:hypothetical protein